MCVCQRMIFSFQFIINFILKQKYCISTVIVLQYVELLQEQITNLNCNILKNYNKTLPIEGKGQKSVPVFFRVKMTNSMDSVIRHRSIDLVSVRV